MEICYPVQRTHPEPLTGSEVYIHDLVRGFERTDDVTLATASDPAESSGAAPPSSYRIERFRSVDLAPVRLPMRWVMLRDPSGLISRGSALPLDGLLHTASYGFFSPGMLSWLRHHRFDLVHAAAVPVATAWVARRGSADAGTPLVLSPFLHLDDPEIRLPYVHRLLHGADHLIAVTETEREYLLSMGIPPDRVSVIPPWIDVANYTPGVGSRFRVRWGIAESDFVVLVPRKLEDKGAFHTLAALDVLARRGLRPVCVVLGSTRAYLQRRVDRFARRLEREGISVYDVGYLPLGQLRDTIAASNVVVEPSRMDSFGMIYEDAWMHGRPVIAARVGAVPDVVRDGTNGLLVPYGNVEAIADAIASLMGSDELCARLGKNGRAEALGSLDSTHLVPRLRAVYESVRRHAN